MEDSTAEPPVAGADASTAVGSSAGKKSNVDPLVYLREFISNKKKVQYQDDWLDFDGHKIHKSTRCAFRPQKGSPLIDVGSVWWMWHSTSADRHYTQASTNALDFTYIGIDRRGDLCDFLLGKAETCTGLEEEVLDGRKRPRERAPRWPTKKAADSLADTLSYEDVVKRVRCVQDLDVVIRRPGRLVPNANMILKIAQDEWQTFSSGAKQAEPVISKPKGQVPLHVELEEMLQKDQKKLPILLVPANKHAPVNLLNVQDLLQYGVYSKPDEEHTMFFESTRAEVVEVSRNIGGKLWTFEVRDSVKNFTKEEWRRTVLVITDGHEWQFKNWPFETVVDLFQTMVGIYFYDKGKPLPVHVHNWPCLKLEIPTVTSKHRYTQLRDDIFSSLEAFMNQTRPKKFVNESKLHGGRRKPLMMKNVL